MRMRGGATAPSRAIVLAATALLVFVALSVSQERPSREAIRVSAASGVLASSRDGSAILSVDGIKPGESENGTVTLTNGAPGVQTLTLSSAALADTAGAGGGLLSRRLVLTVERVSPDPAVLFAGAMGDLGAVAAGELSGRAAATYRFTVLFPEGGTAIDDAYQGGSASVTWRWQAETDADPAARPPAAGTPVPAPVEPVGDGWGTGGPRGLSDGPVRLWIGGGRQQRVAGGRRGGGFVVLARCSPACSLQARLTYLRRGRVRALSARTVGHAGWGQTPQRLVFRLKPAELRVLRPALRRGVQGTLTLRATAPGYGPAVTTRRIRLRRWARSARPRPARAGPRRRSHAPR